MGWALTRQPLLLVARLLLAVELVEGAGGPVGEERGELLRLQLLLDTVELAAAGRHCGDTEPGEEMSGLVSE